MKLSPRQRKHQPQGFLLLEVVLALALFSTIAVAMTAALNQMAVASRSSRAEGRVLRALESVVAEVAHQPAEFGVFFRVDVARPRRGRGEHHLGCLVIEVQTGEGLLHPRGLCRGEGIERRKRAG